MSTLTASNQSTQVASEEAVSGGGWKVAALIAAATIACVGAVGVSMAADPGHNPGPREVHVTSM